MAAPSALSRVGVQLRQCDLQGHLGFRRAVRRQGPHTGPAEQAAKPSCTAKPTPLLLLLLLLLLPSLP